MKLPSQLIEGLSSTDGGRYVLEGVFCDAANERLVATNGHVLGILPMKPDKGELSGMIPLRAIKLARDAKRRIPKKLRRTLDVICRILPKSISVTSNHDGEVSVIRRDTSPAQFPKYESVIPLTRSGPPTITLSAEYLMAAYEAISGDGVGRVWHGISIWLDKEDPSKHPALIAPNSFRDGCGLAVLMPIHCDLTAETVLKQCGFKPEPKKADAKKAS